MPKGSSTRPMTTSVHPYSRRMASKKWLKLWTESEGEANTTLLHTWNLLHHHEPERRAVPVPLEMKCFKHATTGNVEQASESVQVISMALLVGNARDKPGFPKSQR
ncbi:hypothetical protein M9X92_003660 [Pyricularia oryzae]|nr:hypothetical protein M9X92_003660 [Pyricularia oryzae]